MALLFDTVTQHAGGAHYRCNHDADQPYRRQGSSRLNSFMIARDSGRATILLAVGITIAAALPVFLVAALFTEIADDITVPRYGLGVIVASYWVAAALVSVVAGKLTARIGARKVVLLTLAIAVSSLLCSALIVPSWQWLVVWTVVGGVATGTSHPATNHLLALRVSVKNHSLAFGLKQSAVPLATLASGLSIPLIALTLGWRWAFATGAVTALLLIFAFLAFGPRRLPSGTKRVATKVPLSPELSRFFMSLACVTALGAAGATIVASFGVISAVDRGIEAGAAGFLLSAASAVGAFMRIGVGAAAGRDGRDALKIIAVMQLLGGAGIFLMVPNNQWTYALGLILAFGIGWGWPGLVHFSVSRIAGPATPAATGIVQTGTYIGCAAGPLLAGAGYSVWGDQAIWLLSAFMLTIAGCIAFLVSKRPRPATPLAPK